MALQPEQVLPILRGMFGPKISVAAHLIGAPTTALTTIEERAITPAISARQIEFQAGRHAVKAALLAAGATHPSVPMGKDRAPIWPTGFTGAISHSSGLAIAAAASVNDVKALGLDLEPTTPLEPELWTTILVKAEYLWLKSQPQNEQGKLAKLIFSIKECVYKTQYIASKALLDFNAFETTLDLNTGHFQAVFQHDIAPYNRGQVIRGNLAMNGDFILTTAML